MTLIQSSGFSFFAGPEGFDPSAYRELRVLKCLEVPAALSDLALNALAVETQRFLSKARRLVELRDSAPERLAAENERFLGDPTNLIFEELVSPRSLVNILWAQKMSVACELDRPFVYSNAGDSALSVVVTMRPALFVQLATGIPAVGQVGIIVPHDHVFQWTFGEGVRAMRDWLATNNLDLVKD